MSDRARPAAGLLALIVAGLACGPTVTGPDTAATVNAVSTVVQLTVAAWTPTPGGPPPTSLPPPTLAPATVVQPPTEISPGAPTPAATWTLAPSARPNGSPVTAPFLSAPPTIDGVLDDWASLPYSIDQIVFRPENWTGANDHSGSFAVAWDRARLYLAVSISDDTYAQTQQGELIFRGDSVELLFDSDLLGDFSDSNLSGDDFQIGLTRGVADAFVPEAYLWFPASQAGQPRGVALAGQPGAQGYQIEAAILWSALGLTAPQAGDRFGFAVSSSDNDSPGTAAQQSMISYVATRRLTDPTTWGTLILIP